LRHIEATKPRRGGSSGAAFVFANRAALRGFLFGRPANTSTPAALAIDSAFFWSYWQMLACAVLLQYSGAHGSLA